MLKGFLLLITIFIGINANSLIGQSNTFERSYPSFGKPSVIGLKTIELPNNESLILGSRYPYPWYTTWSDIILTKINNAGYTIWRKEIETPPTKCRKSNQILLTEQNDILLINVQSSDSLYVLNIKKLDLNGVELSSYNLITAPSIVGCAITKTQDDNYLISYYGGEGYETINILKINQQLNILWQKNIYANVPLIADKQDFFIKKWGFNDYAIGFNNSILKINSNGDSLFVTLATSIHNFTSETVDGSLLLSGTKTLIKIDSSNNIIWTRNFLRDPGPAIQTSDGNYLIYVNNYYYADTDSIIKIDEMGDLIWARAVQGTVYNINENADKTLLCSGILYTSFFYYLSNYGPNCWILKTDSSGDYKAINLITPIGSEKLLTFSKYLIGWHSNGIEKINLYYSIDDGKKWNIIEKNITADTSQFSWSVPLLFIDSIKIKIEDADNPNIFNFSEYPFYVSVYQPTDYISTNEILMWIGSNGMGSHNPYTDADGFFWPGGDSATIPAIFVDGLVWGGKVNEEIRVNGNTYRYGLKPGRILEDGTADNPLSTQSKIFKIRKDWQTLPESVLKDRLEYDYNHWPVEAGAPWDDVNEDDVYTPGFDKPKFIGDETLFYVANELDTARCLYTYGSNPIGLEFQTTVFGFNREDLKDVVFKKYRVINKGSNDITEMYFSYWSDELLGYGGDTGLGCDSSLNLSFSFNLDNNDEGYYGINPPAVAHMFVQGPKISSSNQDSARFDNGWEKNFKNLPITAFAPIINGSATYRDAELGDYNGTLHFYNQMHGLLWNENDVIDPLSGQITKFPFSGDPVTGTGWYQNQSLSNSRRLIISSGPFNIAHGDTQEVCIAIFMARGNSNLNSITKLRELAAHVQEFYNTELVEILNTKETIAPLGFTLYQNYPNPFNPKTTIEYEVPEKTNVTIIIYDILGRKVKTLVDNEEKVRWKYKVKFDGSALASGVYFYRIQAGSFTQTKKMIVLK